MEAYQIGISHRFSIAPLMNTDSLVSYGENVMELEDRKCIIGVCSVVPLHQYENCIRHPVSLLLSETNSRALWLLIL